MDPSCGQNPPHCARLTFVEHIAWALRALHWGSRANMPPWDMLTCHGYQRRVWSRATPTAYKVVKWEHGLSLWTIQSSGCST